VGHGRLGLVGCTGVKGTHRALELIGPVTSHFNKDGSLAARFQWSTSIAVRIYRGLTILGKGHHFQVPHAETIATWNVVGLEASNATLPAAEQPGRIRGLCHLGTSFVSLTLPDIFLVETCEGHFVLFKKGCRSRLPLKSPLAYLLHVNLCECIVISIRRPVYSILAPRFPHMRFSACLDPQIQLVHVLALIFRPEN